MSVATLLHSSRTAGAALRLDASPDSIQHSPCRESSASTRTESSDSIHSYASPSRFDAQCEIDGVNELYIAAFDNVQGTLPASGAPTQEEFMSMINGHVLGVFRSQEKAAMSACNFVTEHTTDLLDTEAYIAIHSECESAGELLCEVNEMLSDLTDVANIHVRAPVYICFPEHRYQKEGYVVSYMLVVLDSTRGWSSRMWCSTTLCEDKRDADKIAASTRERVFAEHGSKETEKNLVNLKENMWMYYYGFITQLTIN